MLICFYFVLFFIAKSLSFCCEECCGDCCCDWWNNLWEDCYKESNKEEEEKEEEKKDDFWNDYRKKQERMNLQNIEEIGKQKKELKNKIRKYLRHIEKQVGNINNNFRRENPAKEEIYNQISKINELIENFQKDEYFNTYLIEKIRKDWEELQDLCSKADIITFDDFYKKNEEWGKFLEENDIHETYKEEKYITPENFSLENTLEKLRNNFGTYLLEIFKTRLFPVDANGEKYKKDFMNFYSDYQIDVFKNTLIIEDSLLNFYRQILQKVTLDDDDDRNRNMAFNIYKKALLTQNYLYLGYALLTDGDEVNIIEKIHRQIKCAIFKDEDRLKKKIIPPLINSFKHNIVEIIKDSFQEQLNVNKNFQKNNSENIKNTASRKYNEAIENLKGEEIKLTFHNSYGISMETTSFFKDCKLSVLFDYVLSKGREFYASDDEENIVNEELGCVNYEDEKGKLELKTAQGKWADSLNEKINQNENITIGEFYEKLSPNVFMFFKKK